MRLRMRLGPGEVSRRYAVTFRFQVERMPSSGLDVREYVAVYGCVRTLTTAVVAVTVAVRDTSGPPAPEAASQIQANPSSSV